MLALAFAVLLQPADGPDPVAAVRPLAAWAGEYALATTEFDRDRAALAAKPGRAVIKVRAGGHVVTVEKSDEGGYDDILAVQYDEDARAVRAVMFMPLPKPRPMTKVTLADGKAVFDYAPLTLGDTTVVTRETITRQPDGGLKWLVEWKQPDGSYLKRREVVGKRK